MVLSLDRFALAPLSAVSGQARWRVWCAVPDSLAQSFFNNLSKAVLSL